VRVLVFPRSPNPYQDDLYGAMRSSAPLTTWYVGALTPSQTVNLALLPLEILAWRALGARVLHLHWVYPFAPVWARSRRSRRVMRAWFGVVLFAAAATGVRIIWTAHNLVPHEPVFDDDEAARRALVRRCHAVIAHSDAVADEVRSWGARDVTVIPAGLDAPSTTPDRATASVRLGLDPNRFRVLHFGIVREYKGIDTLLAAVASWPPSIAAEVDVVIVGACPDEGLRATLTASTAAIGRPERVHLRFDHVTDEVLDAHLAAADVVAFPFRAVTSSSSVGRALAAGVPVVLPALATLADVPEAAAVRYDPADPVVGLAGAIARLAVAERRRLDAMAGAARRTAAERTWPQAAERTWRVLERVAGGEPVPEPARPVGSGVLR
jgi:glycosyltransferase involved in cell wall biosynthesis